MKPYDQTKGLGSVSFNLLKRQTPTHMDLISSSHFFKKRDIEIKYVT